MTCDEEYVDELALCTLVGADDGLWEPVTPHLLSMSGYEEASAAIVLGVAESGADVIE